MAFMDRPSCSNKFGGIGGTGFPACGRVVQEESAFSLVRSQMHQI
jgi:hypothetical protein